MPSRPAKPCGHPGCSGFKPCAEHPPIPWDHRGKTAAQRGYDAEWQRFRARHLRLHPRCVDCGRPASEVDHVRPLSEGGARLDHANAASRCGACHGDKTKRDHARRLARQRRVPA